MNNEEEKYKTLQKAISRLEEAVEEATQNTTLTNAVREMLRDSIIQRFEFTLELAWKYLRTVLINQSILPQDVSSPKKTIREAFKGGTITNGHIWIDMLDDRNLLSHTYNQEDSIKIEQNIISTYLPELKSIKKEKW